MTTLVEHVAKAISVATTGCPMPSANDRVAARAAIKAAHDYEQGLKSPSPNTTETADERR